MLGEIEPLALFLFVNPEGFDGIGDKIQSVRSDKTEDHHNR
jgi:hypothetical protein